MDILNTAVVWLSYGMAAYIIGVTIFLMANIAIGAIKARSALWWYLVYSVVVVGMLLAGLEYLPSMVLESANDGIEASAPEMERFALNIRELFETAVNSGESGGASLPETTSDTTPQEAEAVDPDVGGGAPDVLPPTMTPDIQILVPTSAATPTGTPSPTSHPGESTDQLSAEATARYATVQAADAGPQPTATFDILHPPTPEIWGQP